MFKITQHKTSDGRDQWDIESADGRGLGMQPTYEGALTAALAALALTAAPGDGPGLLAETWSAEMAFQLPTGDGRDFSQCAWSWRDPTVSTLPLMLQTETEMGHFGAELAGFISTVGGQNPVRGTGRFYDSEMGRKARDMLEGGRRFGVSVDPGSVEITCTQEDEFGNCIGDLQFLSYEIIGLTMTPFPGFAHAAISLDSGVVSVPSSMPMMAAAPIKPPHAWFEMREPGLGDDLLIPQSSGGYAVPLTITEEGQVFGHIADGRRRFLGRIGDQRTPPRSACGYARFHLGAVTCDDGTTVATGPLTCDAMHAPLRGLTLEQARDYYANAALSWADVRVSDGQFGPWACGALRPDVTDDQRRALQALSLSGDWRPVQPNGIEMIAVLSVNCPGFPIEREALAASGLEIPTVSSAAAYIEGDEMKALVGAGIVQRCPECAERARMIANATLPMREGYTDPVLKRLTTIEERMDVIVAALEPQVAAQLRARVHVA